MTAAVGDPSSAQSASANSTSPSPSLGRLSAYGALRMPLALLELPLFVLLPNYYSSVLGVELAIVGAVLFLTRLFDAVLDPALGGLIDGRNGRRLHYRTWIWLALPIVAVGFVAVVNPPAGFNALGTWLAITSAITYLGYSIASIAYQAWGAEIGATDRQRARVTGVREGFGLVGVLIAAAWLTPQGVPTLTTLFIVMAVGCALALLFAPPGRHPMGKASNARAANTADDAGRVEEKRANTTGPWHRLRWLTEPWQVVRENSRFRWLLLTLLVNGIATAIPATLVLFFVSDVLQAADSAPLFLGIYFLCGALGMPLWVWLVGRASLRKAWLAGMGFSIVAFAWALGLGAGDTTSFAFICALTGLALGADLAMPPALLASVIADTNDAGRREGAWFGIWNFTTKFNLAAAAGLSLPLLALGGYEPGVTAAVSGVALPLVYAGLPCLLKLIAAGVLFTAPIGAPEPRPGAGAASAL